MFFKKKKEVVKKHNVEPEVEVYVIPQIPEDVVGLRVNKNQFKKTLAASPMEGPYTKDVVVVPETDNHTDIKLAYDPFRVNKKLSKEDEIERYGKTYHEFKSVDELLDTKEYEERISKVEEKTASIGINFGIVYEAEEISDPFLQPNAGMDFDTFIKNLNAANKSAESAESATGNAN